MFINDHPKYGDLHFSMNQLKENMVADINKFIKFIEKIMCIYVVLNVDNH